MRLQLMEILACPVCKGELTLVSSETDGEEILAGTLTCEPCAETYPIKDGIPNLLPPDMRTG